MIEDSIPIQQEQKKTLARDEFTPQEDDLIKVQFAIAQIESSENVD